jgi:hypothetical protein
LVRCLDNTFAPALESRLDYLISSGLISAFLSNGKWMAVTPKKDEPQMVPAKKLLPNIAAFVAAPFGPIDRPLIMP